VDDAPGTVTLYGSGRTGLYADDYGVTVRNARSRTRRFAWAEISCFADGARMSEGSYFWVLHMVLHTGEKVMVPTGPPTPETLAGIRQVAARYGVPADLAGVPVKNGRPAHRGLYEDPGGQGGLRYWDGRQWSPLLPDIGKPGTVKKSLSSWSALLTAEGRWTGATTQAMRTAMAFALMVAVSAALLAWTLLNELGFYHVAQRDRWPVYMWLILYGTSALFANIARRDWRHRKFLLKLDKAANGPVGKGR
jgi:hypothetical protein